MSENSERRKFETFEALKSEIGNELGISPWHTVDQEQINTFAEATGDHQWINVEKRVIGQARLDLGKDSMAMCQAKAAIQHKHTKLIILIP